MRPKWIAFTLVWTFLYAAECVLFRSFHPTRMLDVLCVFVMMVGNVAVVLLMRSASPARWGRILAVELVATVVVVLAIQTIYDVLLGPDPRRFGFGFNFASDFALMNLHVWPALAILAWADRRDVNTEL